MVRWAVGTTLSLLIVSLASLGCNRGSDAATSSAGDYEELNVKVLKDGTGPKAEEGDVLYIEYRGTFKNDAQFDTNIDKADKAPFMVAIGEPGSIKGLQDGLIGAQEGGEYEIEIPSSLGYGTAGSSPNIPPNSGLKFFARVLDLTKKADLDVVTTEDIKVGSGPTIGRDDTIYYHFKAYYVNGRKVDDSRLRTPDARPESFVVGRRRAIPGVDYGVIGMQAGGIRKLEIPSTMAWGDAGFITIAGNQKLIVEIECVRVEKAGG
ncbi:MAG: FKBP-type peptidyl-prolyl cis-trans isomerase [Fimbriimonadaceae bacterium]|nr:FKBP-type peptidyl-prolyl cis-trans isomerase [Fimbriimonadaceae bacterium]